MIEDIRSGGAWFVTRKDKYVKMGFSEEDGLIFARECFLKDGTLEGGAYTFGTDWFDISFHGKYIDIYADPDSFESWEVSYDPARGTRIKDSDDAVGIAKRVLGFCRQADAEALAGIRNAYTIDSTNFSFLKERS
jgi:hypothetical protein